MSAGKLLPDPMKRRLMLRIILVLAICLLPSVAFAQAVDPTIVPPEWLIQVMVIVKKIPYIGPFVLEACKWAGVIASLMTALSVCAIAILKMPEIVAKKAGANELADKIKVISDKVLYVLKYLSMFNVQKK